VAAALLVGTMSFPAFAEEPDTEPADDGATSITPVDCTQRNTDARSLDYPDFAPVTQTGSNQPAWIDNFDYRWTGSRYVGIGSRFPMSFRRDRVYNDANIDDPTSGLPAALNNTFNDIHAPLPYVSSTQLHDGVGDVYWKAFPNRYTPLHINVIYDDTMKPHEDDGATPPVMNDYRNSFGQHVSHMFGSVSSSIMNMTNQEGVTRPNRDFNNGGVLSQGSKYAIGSASIGLMAHGQTIADQPNVLGEFNLAVAAFGNVLTESESVWRLINTNGDYLQVSTFPSFVNALNGSENDAWIGASIGGAPTLPNVAGGDASTSLQALATHFAEDENWSPAGAEVADMTGASGNAFLDNKRLNYEGDEMSQIIEYGDNSPYGLSLPHDPGFIYQAQGLRSLVGTFMQNSWVNVYRATGVFTRLVLLHGYPTNCPNGSEGPDGESTADDSTIRDWRGMSIEPALRQKDEGLERIANVLGHIGIFIDEQNPNATPGKPLDNPLIADESANGVYHPEYHASLVTRSSVVIGDACNDNTSQTSLLGGYNTDVLHIHDTVRLLPRCAAPTFEKVALYDLPGLMYFDEARNCLRVAVRHFDPGVGTHIIWREIPFVPFGAGDTFEQSDYLYCASPSLGYGDDRIMNDAYDATREGELCQEFDPCLPPCNQCDDES